MVISSNQGNIKLNYELNLTTAFITVIRPRGMIATFAELKKKPWVPEYTSLCDR